MGFLDTFMVVNNRQIANANARTANAAMESAVFNAENAARQAAIKNAALRELKRLDPNNWLLRQEARKRIGDEGENYYHKFGDLPPLPQEVAE